MLVFGSMGKTIAGDGEAAVIDASGNVNRAGKGSGPKPSSVLSIMKPSGKKIKKKFSLILCEWYISRRPGNGGR